VERGRREAEARWVVRGCWDTGDLSRSVAEPLTAGEMRVLRLLAMGLSLREIAWQLYLTRGGVTACVRRLTAKLGARSTADAVARARTLGLLS
jgi:LuxR family maltose regulon positive regulatory protein